MSIESRSSEAARLPVPRVRLYAVKAGRSRHYVRDVELLGLHGPTLCGITPGDAIGKPKWRAMKTLDDGHVCGTCHAMACREPSTIIFPPSGR